MSGLFSHPPPTPPTPSVVNNDRFSVCNIIIQYLNYIGQSVSSSSFFSRLRKTTKPKAAVTTAC